MAKLAGVIFKRSGLLALLTVFLAAAVFFGQRLSTDDAKPRDVTLASGQLPGPGAGLQGRWDLTAQLKPGQAVCLRFETTEGEQSGGCGKLPDVLTGLKMVPFDASANYYPAGTWVFGIASTRVARLVIEAEGLQPMSVNALAPPGFPVHFYVAVLQPRIKVLPRVTAFDEAGNQIASHDANASGQPDMLPPGTIK